MLEIWLDALRDTLPLFPILLIVYIGIELFEYKFGDKIRENLPRVGQAGPALGAVAGSLPQCGFSVMAAALYSQRLITLGTLLAVFLATSDEAIPIILSQPDKVGILWPLILTKIFIALLAGYFLDFIFRKNNQKTLAHMRAFAEGRDEADHNHHSVIEERACCGHLPSAEAKKFNPQEIFLHPTVHTLKIFFFIFLVSFLINLFVFISGPEVFAKLMLGQSFWQPFLAALIGLIPNCAASVALTQLYLGDTLSFGSVIAGLSASGGLGILVLFREEKNKKEIFKIIGLLFSISVLAGLFIQYFFP